MKDLIVTDPQEVFDAPMERLSDVDGFTIVERNGRRPRVHLLRPWNECNTEKGKSGADTVRITGSREQLAHKLSEMGYRGGVACKRCFRYNPSADVENPVLDLPDAEITETLDKYDDEMHPVEGPVSVEV